MGREVSNKKKKKEKKRKRKERRESNRFVRNQLEILGPILMRVRFCERQLDYQNFMHTHSQEELYDHYTFVRYYIP